MKTKTSQYTHNIWQVWYYYITNGPHKQERIIKLLESWISFINIVSRLSFSNGHEILENLIFATPLFGANMKATEEKYGGSIDNWFR